MLVHRCCGRYRKMRMVFIGSRILFFYKNNFIRTPRLKFGVKFFQKLQRTRHLSAETLQINESLDQEKHFKHVIGVGVEFKKMWIF